MNKYRYIRIHTHFYKCASRSRSLTTCVRQVHYRGTSLIRDTLLQGYLAYKKNPIAGVPRS